MIQAILESALQAPSGDNCQPWKLVVNDNQINIFNLPERDTSLYNYRQMASLIAHGTLIENILIASSQFGFTAKVKYFPDKKIPDLVANIELEKSKAAEEPLFPYISQRTTNRRLYKPLPLTAVQKSKLLNLSRHMPGGELRLVDEPGQKALVAEAIGINDRLVFENSGLHRFLFEHIRWTEEESQSTGDGLYVKTLELAPPDAIGFKLLGNWAVVNVLGKFGLPTIIAKKAQRLCLSSSAVGLITVGDSTDIDFLTGGRLLQRVWLEATRMGLSFHPMTGMIFLIRKVLEEETNGLSPENLGLIKAAHEKIKAAFKLHEETMAMLFRIGYGAPPSARSRRLPLEKVVVRG